MTRRNAWIQVLLFWWLCSLVSCDWAPAARGQTFYGTQGMWLTENIATFGWTGWHQAANGNIIINGPGTVYPDIGYFIAQCPGPAPNQPPTTCCYFDQNMVASLGCPTNGHLVVTAVPGGCSVTCYIPPPGSGGGSGSPPGEASPGGFGPGSGGILGIGNGGSPGDPGWGPNGGGSGGGGGIGVGGTSWTNEPLPIYGDPPIVNTNFPSPILWPTNSGGSGGSGFGPGFQAGFDALYDAIVQGDESIVGAVGKSDTDLFNKLGLMQTNLQGTINNSTNLIVQGLANIFGQEKANGSELTNMLGGQTAGNGELTNIDNNTRPLHGDLLNLSNALAGLKLTNGGTNLWTNGLTLDQLTNSASDFQGDQSNRIGQATAAMQSLTNGASILGNDGLQSAASSLGNGLGVGAGSADEYDFTVGGPVTAIIRVAPLPYGSVGVVHDLIGWLCYVFLFVANYKVFREGLYQALLAPQTRTAGEEILGNNVNFASALVVAGLIVSTIAVIPALFLPQLVTAIGSVVGNPFTAISGLPGWGWVMAACPMDTMLSVMGSHILFRLALDGTVVVTCGIIRFLVGL